MNSQVKMENRSSSELMCAKCGSLVTQQNLIPVQIGSDTVKLYCFQCFKSIKETNKKNKWTRTNRSRWFLLLPSFITALFHKKSHKNQKE